jgi:hypothetical protein
MTVFCENGEEPSGGMRADNVHPTNYQTLEVVLKEFQ